jgi:hypothetical protein
MVFFEADPMVGEEAPHRVVTGVNAARPQLTADLLHRQVGPLGEQTRQHIGVCLAWLTSPHHLYGETRTT